MTKYKPTDRVRIYQSLGVTLIFRVISLDTLAGVAYYDGITEIRESGQPTRYEMNLLPVTVVDTVGNLEE